MMKVAYYFRLEKESEMGYDPETNEPCAVYAGMTADTKKELTEDELKEQHEAFRMIIAYQIGVDAQYVTPISEQEYKDHTENSEEIITVDKNDKCCGNCRHCDIDGGGDCYCELDKNFVAFNELCNDFTYELEE